MDNNNSPPPVVRVPNDVTPPANQETVRRRLSMNVSSTDSGYASPIEPFNEFQEFDREILDDHRRVSFDEDNERRRREGELGRSEKLAKTQTAVEFDPDEFSSALEALAVKSPEYAKPNKEASVTSAEAKVREVNRLEAVEKAKQALQNPSARKKYI
ncbi:unnamed protein product [Caenorhabditis bovis]|uniref:Uncharacterized protein n=1 Tax=Caenorhabditis bovis TaxID=2654633 RepID=A0A8S1F0D3_9PELO|nr:unnamed protein product [Caenorhabditis bovis]